MIRTLTFTFLFLFFFPAQAGKEIHNFYEILKPFEEAVKVNDIEKFRELAKNIDDINVQDWRDKYSILYSILSDINARRDVRFLEILLDAGADAHAKNVDGKTALHEVAIFGTPEHVRILLRAGADINETDRYGMRILHEALSASRSLEFIEVLLEAGADVNVADDRGRTPLHTLAEGYGFGGLIIKIAIIKRFLAIEGIDINARDNEGRTPLHNIATGREQLESIRAFLAIDGIDINARDNEGRTPLHYLIKSARFYLVAGKIKLFLEAGADITIKDKKGRDVYTLISESTELTAKEKMALLTAGIENRCF